MKKEQGRDRKNSVKKNSARKGAEKKKTVKTRMAGNTEILDLDLLEEEINKPEEQTAECVREKKAMSRTDKVEKAEKKESKTAMKAYGEKMPPQPVSLSDETLELLELDELLAQEEVRQKAGRAQERAASGEKRQSRKKDDGASTEDDSYLTYEPKKKKASSKDDSYLTFEPKRNGAPGKTAGASGKLSGRSGKRSSEKNAGPGRKKDSRPELGVIDVIIALTGVLVLFVGVAAFGVYRNASEAKDQVAAMAQVGEKMETIGYAGEDLLVAVADARIAALELAKEQNASEEETENDGGYEEKDLVSKVKVGLKLTSVQKDLKIKFTNKETGKLIGNQVFTVKIDGPESMTKKDDDKDGIIYINSIKAGEYTVTITAPEEIDGAAAAGIKGSVTVRDQIEYKKIDVTDEVKKESEINAAKEDTAIAPPVESAVTDTVEWVESTKTPLNGGSITYEQVSKSDIPDPSTTALLESIWTADGENGAYLQNTVKLAQNAAPFEQSAVKMLEKGVYFTQDTEVESSTGAAEETGQEGETPSAEPEEPPKEELLVTDIDIEGVGDYEVGDSVTLTAKVTTNGAGQLSDSDYVWSGDVNGTGPSISIPTQKAGTVQVTLSVRNMSSSAAVTIKEKEVPPAEVTGVTVSAEPAKAEEGKEITVKASVSMSDGSSFSGKINWSVNDGGSLSENGSSASLTRNSAGKVTVTAEANGKKGSTEVEFTKKPAENEAVSVSMEAPGSMTVGEEKTLKCTVKGSAASTKWSVSDSKIASIDANSGKVKALAAGKVTVTVKVTGKGGDSASATGELTVNAAKTGELKLDASSFALKIGEKKTVKAILTNTGLKAVEWKSSDESVVKIVESKSDSCTIQALKQGKATITATGKENKDKNASCEVTVELTNATAPLKDKNGNQLYYKSGETYKEATVADYYKYDVFYRKKDSSQYLYTGWQNIDGKRYYFDKNGIPVTGEQTIQGVKYSFNSDGSLKVSGAMGIDISKHNGTIDWNAVKNAGVNYVILRCGYRGSATGVLVEDEKFRSNIQGAQAAGLKVGIYFFSQAVNEVEAVEEASLTISLIRNYKITYPVYMDVEAANGRADGLDAATRTKVIKAFCETIRNSGYTAGVYANKTWLSSKMNVGSLGSYKIWLAQYAATPTYNGRYEMWQYSSSGKIAGIPTKVDLNISYMSY